MPRRVLSAALASLLILVAARSASAHAFDPAVLEIRDGGGALVDVVLRVPPALAGRLASPLEPRLPAPCRRISAISAISGRALRYDCGATGARGLTVSVSGLDGARAEVLVHAILDGGDGGEELTGALHADSDTFTVPDRRQPPPASVRSVLGSYLALGVRHILGGPDHLLFLFGLLLLVEGAGALVRTVTAFTLAHSLSLALAATGVLKLPQPPVEVLIAASVLLLAVELARPASTRTSPSLLRRTPALAALFFGLIHGLGFAAALADAGLPANRLAPALLGFNCGVEMGQLAFVALLILPVKWLRRRAQTVAPAYAMGAVSAAWLLARLGAVFVLTLAISGCRGDGEGAADLAPYVEERQPCAVHDPLRRLYFGDLHVHTGNSFDAHLFDVRTTPAQAYGFARGEPVLLPPLDGNGAGTRTLRIDRPLDFAAVTDHSEFLGEIELCSTPGSALYDSQTCRDFRAGGNPQVIRFGTRLTLPGFTHDSAFCGPGGTGCAEAAGQVWRGIQEAAAAAYDKSAACTFTSFVGYEYTAATFISTLHRNVIFKNDRVPSPVTFFEENTPQGLWRQLRATCNAATPGCDVLAIPHNSNESNGRAFFTEYPDANSIDEERAQAAERAAIEPLVEVYQHKGDSECMNGLAGIAGDADEACDFEKSPRTPFMDCRDGRGSGGAQRTGCYSARDFVRGALLEGLREEARLGVNPFALGFIASTDTHNGTPGAVAEDRFAGHRGLDDDTPERRLGTGNLTAGGLEFSPGGLVAVWAEENSRPAIFEALRRRETYGTSGPRIAVRLFGGWNYDSALCGDARLVQRGYDGGVPMGGVLPVLPDGAKAPGFVVSALRDPGTEERPGARLERVQIVKGWLAADGTGHQRVYDVAGAKNPAPVDTDRCAPTPGGADSLCAVWIDPDFRPGERAFYYARVLENPGCRWSTWYCNALPPAERPPACSGPSGTLTIQERAWTSPIWYRPR